jgi:hypothetical protein
MTIVDNVVREAMVYLLRQVPWGDSRDTLEGKASCFEREASEERRWDNYSSGAHLSWQGLFIGTPRRPGSPGKATVPWRGCKTG